MTALRLERRLRRTKTFALDYTLDAIPFARLSQNEKPAPTRPACPSMPSPASGCQLALFSAGSANALGASPLGLQLVFRHARALQLHIGASGGVLWFDRKVPSRLGTQLNFTGMGETGIQYVTRSGNGLNITYRLHHISNAGRGRSNPGIASQLFTVGLRKQFLR